MTSLATVERERLEELELVVERGLVTFIEVGTALAEIRDRRLYRETHDTFEDYCREQWGFERAHAYRQIRAAEVAVLVSPMGDIPNERQARELVALREDEEEVVEVWREARAEAELHGKRLTAKVVRNAVQRRVKRILREEKDAEYRERVATCAGCSVSRQPSLDIGWSSTGWAGGTIHDWCPDCTVRRIVETRQKRERALASRSEEEIQAEADSRARWSLQGSLKAFVNPDGEGGGLSEYLRGELDALQKVEAWRHPELARRIGAVAGEIEAAAREIREWGFGQA